MSLFATWLLLDDVWAAEEDEADVGAPFAYRGSHVLPSSDSSRGGWVEIGAIPAYCGKDGGLVDFLRLGVGQQFETDDGCTVLLDRAQVTLLRDRLTLWLERSVEVG